MFLIQNALGTFYTFYYQIKLYQNYKTLSAEYLRLKAHHLLV